MDNSVTKRKVTAVKETSILQVIATYIELHQKTWEYYHIPELSETYLATFYCKKIETGFKDLGTYALAQREKKRQFIYIFTTLDLHGS